jgi:hypothetical protein
MTSQRVELPRQSIGLVISVLMGVRSKSPNSEKGLASDL